LSLAIQGFKGEYNRKFMLQLISSQLDMDRMDYLKRDMDFFYSGVAENVNSERLIQMMVVDDYLVVKKKTYSVAKFLMSGSLMYWQAYFFKTSLVAELILMKILKRAKINAK
jgi:HD superfamily phosphohydrolase